jgi:3-oxosteroid 1-dehydrogenase
MAIERGDAHWDHTVDLLIVGSGAGAMVAAIYARDHGLSTLLIEKTELYGGNSAMSGGAMWIPTNPQMLAGGVPDSREDALTYLRHVTKGQVPEEKIRTYVDGAPQMLAYLRENSRLRTECCFTYPDYYAEAPGGKPGGRSLEPAHFDAKLLGAEFERMREPAYRSWCSGACR